MLYFLEIAEEISTDGELDDLLNVTKIGKEWPTFIGTMDGIMDSV